MVAKRLVGLKRRFYKDDKYYNAYKAFLDDIIANRDAEELLDEYDKDEMEYKWYIQHHGVYHPKKPNNIRVVFDCSAKYKGTCLNDHLLQGPDLLNSLIGVLCRFREKPVAIMGDIERMFHQFKVNKEDRNYLRFLWWKGGNLESKPRTYRMRVHIFGATSSPGCAEYGLKKLAADNTDKYDKDVINFVTNDFYVDDGLGSLENEDEAIRIITGAIEMCREGNLRLHKSMSFNKSVMNVIPSSENLETKMQDINLDAKNEKEH